MFECFVQLGIALFYLGCNWVYEPDNEKGFSVEWAACMNVLN